MPRTNSECPSVHLLEVRERLLTALRRKITLAMATLSNATLQVCKTRRHDIEKKLDALDENWKEIELGNGFEDEVDLNTLYNENLDLEEESSLAFIHLGEITDRRPSVHIPPPAQKQFSRLPQLTIPIFDGQLENWLSFKSMFQSVMREHEDMDDVQKLQTLMSVLEEEPSKQIRNIPFEEGNFNVAWTALENKYYKRRALVDKQIDSLLDHPTINAKSSKSISSIIDRLNESLEVIRILNVSTADWSPIITRIVIRKMDITLREAFEEFLNGSTEIPTIDHLKVFLDTRSRVAENYMNEPTRNDRSYTETSAAYLSSQPKRYSSACVICAEHHSIYECDKFKTMELKRKVNTILQRNLCTNCLSQTHGIENCAKKHACRRCGAKHSDFLHEYFAKIQPRNVLYIGKRENDDETDSELDYESE